MRTVAITTELSIPPAAVWDLVQTPAVMRHVSWPLTVFTPVSPAIWRPRWSPGDHRFRIRALAVLPVGEQTVSISVPLHDPAAGRYQLRDNGHGQLARTWDHLITVEPALPKGKGAAGPMWAVAGAQSRYTDEVVVDAGRLTIAVWLWAHVLFRWRQRRWRRLPQHQPAQTNSQTAPQTVVHPRHGDPR